MKKEEIRTKWIRHTPLMKLDECVDKAMQEYADQQTKELQQRVEELYLKNKELKTHLTQQIECTEHIKDICDNYESENQQLQQRFEGLQNSLEINEKLSVEATNDFVKAFNEIDEEKNNYKLK